VGDLLFEVALVDHESEKLWVFGRLIERTGEAAGGDGEPWERSERDDGEENYQNGEGEVMGFLDNVFVEPSLPFPEGGFHSWRPSRSPSPSDVREAYIKHSRGIFSGFFMTFITFQ
jgi:hypothetical protein